jgi:hypothetical protein
MRQIQVGACLLVIFAAVAACSGESFSSGENSGNTNGSPAFATGGTTNNRGSSGSGSHDIASENGGDEADQGTPPSSSGGTGSSSGGTGSSSSGNASAGTSAYAGGGAPAPSGNECSSGSVKFKMVPGADLPHDYLCDAGCGSGWLTITDAAGATAFSLFSACGVASCETCELQACVASACLPKPLTGEGVELTWNGSFFTKDTCGEAMACQKPACVKPGKYKAKACAAVNAGNGSGGSCTPKDSVSCAEAEFEFPSVEPVKLVLTK